MNEYPPDKVEVDLETALRHYMPAMFRLLKDDNNLEPEKWERLNRKFVITHQNRLAKQSESSSPLIVDANLYDIIISTFRGDKSALRFVGYIDILFKLLAKNLLPEEKVMVKSTLYDTLVSHDHKFRNYIGELSILSKAVENRNYTLLGVEIDTIVDGNTADFTLLNNFTGKTELFEVVNIHINRPKSLKGKLFKKIKEKLKEKTRNKIESAKFTLIPVLWAEWKVLKEIEQLYKSGNGVKIEGVNEPFALCVFSGENDMPVYRFLPITKVFPEGRVLVNWVD